MHAELQIGYYSGLYWFYLLHVYSPYLMYTAFWPCYACPYFVYQKRGLNMNLNGDLASFYSPEPSS